ncbi:uncharacterized protein BDZ99DRAFT_519921 [Mytilinidion resinicola]|uniref:Myb-like DNA-binding domain-containing protein n=1 Tax=Mytilinidion resinicola TaxID=574789 RepID=A0A6A6YR74_9PEZI|nr:uncharacterized protein BDZ99DRAFT_519921 [Mytilinidion resinicola]KAF2811271.1 hypothetical protein BDZ99DRAFT_519921 [Mytilinidion resinicola]
MPTDKQLVALCYSILKQLELKHIDWKRVAADNAIQNPHAARMRYSRFKTQMERAGLGASQKQAEKRKRGAEKGGKGKGGVGGDTGDGEDDEEVLAVVGKRVKGEGDGEGMGVKREIKGEIKVEKDVKVENGEVGVKVELGGVDVDVDVKMEPMQVVKMEDMWEEGTVWGGLKYEADDDCIVEGVRSVKAVF